MKTFAILTTSVLLLYGVNIQSASAAMSCKEIKSQLFGKSLRFQGRTARGTQRISSGGAGWIRMSNGFTDTGRLYCKGNRLCAKWKKIRKGKTACFSVTRTAPGQFRTSHGVKFWTN